MLELSPLFDEMYAADGDGRASIPPERLLKASLLISLYSVRSERAFCEELTYHLLFLDMDMLEPSFDHSTALRDSGGRGLPEARICIVGRRREEASRRDVMSIFRREGEWVALVERDGTENEVEGG